MSVYKRGKTWHCDFTVAGRRVRMSTEQRTKTAAEMFESMQKVKAKSEGPAVMPRKAPRLAEFESRFFKWVDEVVANGRRKVITKKYYKNGWKRIKDTNLAWIPLDQITAHSVEVQNLGGSAAWVNQAIRTLRRMLGKAEEWHVIAKAPRLPLMPEVGRESGLSSEEETALLSHAGSLLRDVLPIAQDTGMRPVEVASMRIEHINWQTATYFNESGKTKRSRRIVPLSKRVFDLLFVRCGARTEGWVFPSKRSKAGHVTRDALTHAFARARESAGLKGPILYGARHAFGTEVYRATGNLKAVMDSMGHADVRTAMRYQHPELDVVREAIDARNLVRHNSRHSDEVKQ